jgi:hypothetical protein
MLIRNSSSAAKRLTNCLSGVSKDFIAKMNLLMASEQKLLNTEY